LALFASIAAMPVPVGVRLGFLSKYWGFEQQKLVVPLGIETGKLSTVVNGKTALVDPSPHSKARAVCELLEQEDLLQPFGTSADALFSALHGTNSEFFTYLANHGPDLHTRLSWDVTSPIPGPASNGSGGAQLTQLIGVDGFDPAELRVNLNTASQVILGARRKGSEKRERLFFLYRLGFSYDGYADFKEGKDDKLRATGQIANGLVLRRIAVKFFEKQNNDTSLGYEEYYMDPSETEFTAHASAYAFRNFLTVFARDKEGDAFQELSLMQIDWLAGRAARAGIFPGVVTMKSDCSANRDSVSPTAYRILLKPAPKELSWKEAMEKASGDNATKPLGDVTGDGVVDFRDGKGWGSETDLSDDATKHTPWSYYFNRLNVRETPADLLVAWATTYKAYAESRGASAAR
jgi:hypothetical protein